MLMIEFYVLERTSKQIAAEMLSTVRVPRYIARSRMRVLLEKGAFHLLVVGQLMLQSPDTFLCGSFYKSFG